MSSKWGFSTCGSDFFASCGASETLERTETTWTNKKKGCHADPFEVLFYFFFSSPRLKTCDKQTLAFPSSFLGQQASHRGDREISMLPNGTGLWPKGLLGASRPSIYFPWFLALEMWKAKGFEAMQASMPNNACKTTWSSWSRSLSHWTVTHLGALTAHGCRPTYTEDDLEICGWSPIFQYLRSTWTDLLWQTTGRGHEFQKKDANTT